MFIDRRQDGSIYGAWTVRQWVGQEEIADNAVELVAFLTPVVIDQSDLNNMNKAIKVAVMLTRQYANALKAGTYTAKSLADLTADVRAIWQGLP